MAIKTVVMKVRDYGDEEINAMAFMSKALSKLMWSEEVLFRALRFVVEKYGYTVVKKGTRHDK